MVGYLGAHLHIWKGAYRGTVYNDRVFAQDRLVQFTVGKPAGCCRSRYLFPADMHLVEDRSHCFRCASRSQYERFPVKFRADQRLYRILESDIVGIISGEAVEVHVSGLTLNLDGIYSTNPF